ncbi:MAG: DNA polymerase Y family protein [Acidimicrobiia bacterium]|nr:DNA polymerase Y family protein [Acidimicrobiia bacterium]
MSAGSAERTCCVWCPDWPVVAWRQADDALIDRPVVVLEPAAGAPVVRAASIEARAEGVRAGLRRREAESRCPGLVAVDVDPLLEARAFEAVARAVESITPRLVLDRPGRCAFPTRGPARYFGGDEEVATQIMSAVETIGVADVRVGIADGAFPALLAARGPGPGATWVVPPGESAEFLASWPVGVLRLAGDTGPGSGVGSGVEESPDAAGALADLLVRLGMPTLGAFAALSESAVTGRFGRTGARAHRLARGLDEHPPALTRPPPDLTETAELDPPAQRLDVTAFAAKAMADRFSAALADRGLACTRVVVEAETEHGERLSRCWRHDGALDAPALAERVRWQLEGWFAAPPSRRSCARPRAAQDDAAFEESYEPSTAGIIMLRLVPDCVVPATGRQLGFWGGDPAAADRAARALARVQGLLGPGAVTTPVLQGGRSHDERVRWVPWGEPREPARPDRDARSGIDGDPAAGDAPTWPGRVPDPAPARVYEPPRPAELLDAQGRPVTVTGRGECPAPPAHLRSDVLPDGGGTIAAWAGPWPEDLRWWDRLTRRRRARWQILTDTGVAALVVLESGRAALEAVYD